MRVRFFAGLLAALLLCSSPSAQISFTSATYLGFARDQTIRFDNFATPIPLPAGVEAQVAALTTRTGDGQTWDFTPFSYITLSDQYAILHTSTAGLPGASNFPAATVVLQQGLILAEGNTASYTYATLTGSAFATVGVFLPLQPDSPDFVRTYGGDGLVQYTFPFTSGTTVSDDAPVTENQDSGTVTYTVSESRTVVGSGTLVTPGGSASCLMIRVQETSTEGSETLSSTRYSWETLTGLGAGVLLSETDGNTFYTALYSVPNGAVVSEAGPSSSATLVVSAAPNPVRGASAVRVLAAAPRDASVTVADMLGREVARLHDGPLDAGDHAFPFDASGLAPGVYVVRVQSGRESVSARLSVVR